jgi:TonB-dependent receptor
MGFKLYIITAFSLLFLFINNSFAQSGNITGRITDASDRSPLWGTNILLDGTSTGTTTDVEGRYRLTGVPAGKQLIVFRYLGYETDSVEVNIVAGTTIELNKEMRIQAIEGEEVVVTAQLQGQTAAINQQLTSNTIVNVISSDKIQELPDANVAESLSRLPGVSLQRDAGEGSKIVVRGLSPKFNSVTVNGERIPATDANDRSVDLSMISQDILAGIEVFKALTPDKDADAIGGTVNLITKNAPEGLAFDFRGQSGYNNHEEDYGQYKFNLTASDRFFDNNLGILATASVQRTNRSSDALNAEYTPPTSEIPHIEITDLNLIDREEIRKRYSAGVNLDYSFGLLNLRLNNFYSETDRDETRRRKTYRIGEFRTEYDLRERHINSSIINSNLNGDYIIGPLEIDFGGSYSLSKQNTPYSNYARFIEVGAYNNGLIKDQGPSVVPQFAKNDLASTYLQYCTFTPESVDDRDFSAQFNIKMPYTLTSDIAGFLKTGFKYRDKNRERDVDEYRTDFEVTDDIAADNPGRWTLYRNEKILIENFIDPSFSPGEFLNGDYQLGPGLSSELLDHFYSEFSNYYELNGFTELNDYDAEEKIYAAYIMTEINLFKDFMILPGIRYEKTDNSYIGKFGKLSGNLGQTGTIRDTIGGRNYEEFLPMLHFRYKILDGLDIRLAYTESLSRPDYFNLVPYESINEAEQTVARGNPNLLHTTAKNYDAFLSLYNRYGLFTVGGYYKEMKNVDYLFSYRETEGQFRNYSVTQPVNSPKGKVYGYELDVQANFSFFPAPFDGIVLNLNYSHIYSETHFPYFEVLRNPNPPYNLIVNKTFRKGRLPGQPEVIWNIAFGYEKGGFSGRISFVHQEDILYLVGERADSDTDYDAFTRIDLLVSQNIWENINVFLNANNLSDVSEGAYYGSKKFPTNEEYFGWTLDLGVRYRF